MFILIFGQFNLSINFTRKYLAKYNSPSHAFSIYNNEVGVLNKKYIFNYDVDKQSMLYQVEGKKSGATRIRFCR